MVKVKGIEFEQVTVRDSYYRRALQYRQKILNYLKKVNLSEDDVNISMGKNAMQKAQASVSWYFCDTHLFYSYNGSAKFVENMAMATQVINYFVQLLVKGEITQDKFIELFAEDQDILKQRKNARKVLGVEEESTDFKSMHTNYQKLAKEHHPDMPNGNTEKFKEINNAHKILKKELC